MRKLYNEFFYIPKHGKIREKVMLMRVAMTIVIMVMCLAAMSITAYAYFSHNVTSGSNTIKAANFEAQITVTSTDQNGETVNPSSTDGKKTVFTFASPGTYTVKLEKENSSTAKTGFCVIYVGDKTYHTQQIGVDINANNEKREFVVFDLKINEPNIVVTIESHWGTSSYYNFDIDESNTFYIMNDPRREIEIGNPVNGASNSDEEKETTSGETTAPTTETTQPADTTAPEITGTSEPSTTTEPSNTTEPSDPANTTEPAVTKPEETTESTETQPTEETTGASTTEASK